MREYELILSRRRTMALEIAPDGQLRVRAPLRTPREKADAFVQAQEAWIEKHLPAVLNKRDALSALTEEEEKLLTETAARYLPPLTERYAQIMNAKHAGVRITGAKKRFGSCGPTDGLCFSRYLLLYPYPAVELVVVHELAHLFRRDHSAAFHAKVRSVFPDEAARNRLLHPQNADIKNLYKNIEILRSETGL